MKNRKTISLTSDITDVCVYRSTALVTRECTYESELESYEKDFKIPGLPLCLEDDSVKISFKSDDKHIYINNTAVIIEDVCREPEFDNTDKLEGLNKRRISLQSRYLNLEKEKSLLVIGPTQKNKPREFDPQKALKARISHLEFVEERRASLISEMADLADKINFIDVEISTIERRNRGETNLKKTAIFTACNISAHKLKFSVTYEIKGPCWCPSYGLRLNGGMDKAELQFKAVVSQNTGENWNGVNLTVSTGNPKNYRKLPEFKSLHLGRAQSHSAKSSWQPPPMDTGKLFSDWQKFKDNQSITASAGIEETLFETEMAYACEPVTVASVATLTPPGGGLTPPSLPPAAGAVENKTLKLKAESGDTERTLKMKAKSTISEPLLRGVEESSYGRRSRSVKAKKMSSMSRSGGDLTACEFEEQEEVIEVVAATDVSRYEKLRMNDPGKNKGKLLIAETNMIYQETLTVNFHQVLHLVSESVRESNNSACPHSLKVRGGYNFIFHSAVPVDIESSPGTVSVNLFTENCSPEMHYLSVPRETPDFFRSLKFQNPTSSPMLAGPVDVYVGGVFLMTVDLKQTASGEDVEISMGVEQGIKLSRNTDFDESHTGLMKGSNALNHNIKNEVTNTLKKDVKIEIRERLPVPGKEEKTVKVDLSSSSPEWQKIPEDFKEEDVEEKGLYYWQTVIPAGESTEFSYAYTISLPAKEEIVGGNRREF